MSGGAIFPVAAGHYRYSDYDDLNGARETIAARFARRGRCHILDAGTGAGGFACALAAVNPGANVLGVDKVNQYLPAAQARSKAANLTNCSFQSIDLLQSHAPPRFDVVATFLATCDLLRFSTLTELMDALTRPLKPGGELVLAEAYPELADSSEEHLGFDLNRSLGYRYAGVADVTTELASRGFEPVDSAFLRTGRRPITSSFLHSYLVDEARFCELDGSPLVNIERLHKEYTPLLLAGHGAEIDSHILMLRFREC